MVSVAHSKSLDKYVITCIHHYGIIQSIFTGLSILCDLPIHPSSCPQLIETTGNFNVSIDLPCPKCHIVEIMSYVTTAEWLLSVSNNVFKVHPCLFVA